MVYVNGTSIAEVETLLQKMLMNLWNGLEWTNFQLILINVM